MHLLCRHCNPDCGVLLPPRVLRIHVPPQGQAFYLVTTTILGALHHPLLVSPCPVLSFVACQVHIRLSR